MRQIRINHFDTVLKGEHKGYVEHHRDKRWVYLAKQGSKEAEGIKVPEPADAPASPKDETPKDDDGKKKSFWKK